MKNKTFITPAIFFSVFLLWFNTGILAQEQEEQAPTFIRMNYIFGSNDTIILTEDLATRRESGIMYLSNAPLSFSMLHGSDTTCLPQLMTDSVGKAVLILPLNHPGTAGTGSMTTYTVVFSGTENYEASSQEFAARPAWITMSFSEEDSIRYIDAALFCRDEKGESIPVGGQTLYLYTPTLFNPMKIGEISLDETGNGRTEFPAGLIGDSTGKIEIYAQLEEHEEFGYVRYAAYSSWGVPKYLLSAEKPSRELWTPVAPLWMIITLIIMLAGVWGHYIYAIVQLVRINRASKKG